jgi:hypothetical protein
MNSYSLEKTILMSGHSEVCGEEIVVDIRESKPELIMPQSITVYWKVEYCCKDAKI